MSYTRVNWQNAPSTATPVNAENLNTMDKGIADAHSQLAEKAKQIDLEKTNSNVNATNLRIDNLVIPLSPENTNIEVTDAHNSIVKNKNFNSLKDRLEEIEQDFATEIKKNLNETHLLDSLLNGVGDEVIINNGIFEKLQRVSNRIYLKDLSWEVHLSTSTDNYYSVRQYVENEYIEYPITDISKAEVKGYSGLMTNSLSVYTPVDNYFIFLGATLETTRLYIKIPKAEIEGDIDEVKIKGWFERNQVSLIYELDEPTIVSFPNPINTNTLQILSLVERVQKVEGITNAFAAEDEEWSVI